MSLYVAGGSFASLANNQTEGTSWSEILGNLLNTQMFNVARPAASNVSISIQLDWIINRCTDQDYIVVLLTNSFRKTLPTILDRLDREKLLTYHTIHESQRTNTDLNFSSKPILENTTMVRPEYKDFYSKYFNSDLQQFEDEYILTGAFTKVLKKTQKLLVCSCGYDQTSLYDTHETDPGNVNRDMFCLPEINFIDLPSVQMLKFGADKTVINHLDSVGHAKVARIFYTKLSGAS
jgi:hypothetical protein